MVQRQHVYILFQHFTWQRPINHWSVMLENIHMGCVREGSCLYTSILKKPHHPHNALNCLPNRDIAQIFDEREDISTSFSLSIAMNLALNAHFDPKLRDRDLIKKNTDCWGDGTPSSAENAMHHQAQHSFPMHFITKNMNGRSRNQLKLY